MQKNKSKINAKSYCIKGGVVGGILGFSLWIITFIFYLFRAGPKIFSLIIEKIGDRLGIYLFGILLTIGLFSALGVAGGLICYHNISKYKKYHFMRIGTEIGLFIGLTLIFLNSIFFIAFFGQPLDLFGIENKWIRRVVIAVGSIVIGGIIGSIIDKIKK